MCGRLLADVGADVTCIDADNATPLATYLNHGKAAATRDDIANADLVVCEGAGTARMRQYMRRQMPRCDVDLTVRPAAGRRRTHPASDLTLMYSSGIARLLTGQVDDLRRSADPPGGRTIGLHRRARRRLCRHACGAAAQTGALIDVSIEEALATLAMTELASAGLHGRSRSRKRLTDGNGATVCILPARDGYTAISPREDRQWAAWLEAMGSPGWGQDPRFATKEDRVANWDALHALMSDWSRQHDKQWIADTAQAARVPSFPLRELPEHFASPQLAHRGFWRNWNGSLVPGSPFGVTCRTG